MIPTPLFRKSACSMLALVLIALPGVAGSTQSWWTLHSWTNAGAGVLLVFEQGKFEGGFFNGVDNDPVTLRHARYESCVIPANLAQATHVPVPYEYESDASHVEPAHDFYLQGDSVLPGDCDADGGQCGRRRDLFDLGSRHEKTRKAGEAIEFFHADGSADCSIALGAAGAAETGSLIRWRVASFPESSTQVLVDSAAPGLSLEAFHQCQSAAKVASVRDRLKRAGLKAEQTVDVEVRDVIASGSSFVAIVGWRERVGGASVQRFGAFDFGTNTLKKFGTNVGRPIGFFGNDPARVLVEVGGDADDDGATGHLTLYSTADGSVQRVPVDCRF